MALGGGDDATTSHDLSLSSSSSSSSLPSPPQQRAAHEPACSQDHVLNCQFAKWYPIFKHCTPRSAVLDLPEEVVLYLQEDGVVLPKGFEISCGFGIADDSDDEVDWDDNNEDTCDGPEFPGLHERLREAIRSLGGAVFPKLNWSCPKDAAWVNGGTLKCTQPGDVLCLMKSSTFVSHDLNHAFDACVNATISRPDTFTLVLRKWCNLHPSMLFRCFVRGRRLVGVCQRDCTSYYAFLDEETERLSGALERFFAAEICKKFPDPDCVADVYVDRRSRVWLLDINPFSSVTDSLLFDWSEDTLAAPLSPQGDDEVLPPDVFLRLYFEPASAPSHGHNGHQATAQNGTESVGELSEDSAASLRAHGTSFGRNSVDDVGFDFEFRCVPSSLYIVPDPMGRYRGPADVEMGTLMGGTGGGNDLEALIETCRLAARND